MTVGGMMRSWRCDVRSIHSLLGRFALLLDESSCGRFRDDDASGLGVIIFWYLQSKRVSGSG